MSKSNSGKNTGKGQGSNLGTGRSRPSTGFVGGNWPAGHKASGPSGKGRGNAPPKAGR